MEVKPTNNDNIVLPANMIPSWRVFFAETYNTLDKIMIKCWGGLGDQICSEPAIRYAKTLFPTSEIYLATHHPELFSHLTFTKVYDLKEVTPNWDNYFVFETIYPPTHLLWQFISHMLSHPVDFSSIAMWRLQLPISEKEISLPKIPMSEQVKSALENNSEKIVVHAGKHWASKTFPKEWWDSMLTELKNVGFTPILIGKEDKEGPHGNTGYVYTLTDGCIDLRDKLSIGEFVSILQNCKYLLSNDSSPIHAAASGDAFIGFIATCKHPDYLRHWRQGEFGRNTKNFGLDGVWNHIDHAPNKSKSVEVEKLPDGLMEKILPNPKDVAAYYLQLKK